MDIQPIKDWLNSPVQDWHTGIALLSASSPKRHLIRVLASKGPTSKSLFRLRYELNRIVKSNPGVSVIFPAKTRKPQNTQNPPLKPRKPNIIKHTQNTQNTTKNTPTISQVPGELSGDPYLDDLYAKKNRCHKEAMSLKHQFLYYSQPQRGKTARRILKLISRRDLIWRQIDYYEKFKIKAPDVLSSTDPSLLELIRQRDNLRCSVSKLKKKIADVTKAKSKDHFHTELAKKLLLIADLDKQINF